MDKQKYLVPRDLTVGQFLYVIRKRMNLGPEVALFLFVEDSHGKSLLPMTGTPILVIEKDHVKADGFVYLTYSGENTFGSS